MHRKLAKIILVFLFKCDMPLGLAISSKDTNHLLDRRLHFSPLSNFMNLK